MAFRTIAYNGAVLGAVALALLLLLGRRPALRGSVASGALAMTAVWASARFSTDGFDRARLLGWTLFLHLPLLFAAWAAMFASARRAIAARTCIALGLACLLAASHAYLVEPRWLEVRRVSISSSRITDPLRIALVADIQTDSAGDYERRAMRTLMRERPDLITIAGDHIQASEERTPAQERALNDVLAQERLSAPLGIVAVKGNVDRPGWERAFEGLGYAVSSDTHTVSAGPVSVTALSERDSFDPTLHIERAPGLHVVVGHSPDYALGNIHADLLLAGHTHGGQVRLPGLGAVIHNTQLPRSAVDAPTRMPEGGTLIVSWGVGMERANAPRVRFLCRPQIVIIEVVPTQP